MSSNNDRPARRAEYVPGYQSALMRSELKQNIRAFREDYNLNDTHMERCITSACIEFAMLDENRANLMKFLRIAVDKDLEASLHVNSGGRPLKESREAGSVG